MQTARRDPASSAAAAAVLAMEVLGILVIWGPIPVAWMWVGGRVYDATGSIAADAGLIFLGFIATTVLGIAALSRLDGIWVALRRRAGHDQQEGALTQVVAISVALGLVLFTVWYYVLSDAYVLPFMSGQ